MQKNLQLQFVKSDSTSIVTPYYITKTSKLFDNYSTFKAALNKVSPKVKESEYYRQAVDLLKSVERISKSARAPELYGKDMTGSPLNNRYKNNKLILINFWASYCIPCREEVPELKKIYNQYKSKGFEIVSVSVDVSRDNWIGASEKDKLPWYNICECVPEEQSKNIQNYVVKSVPTSYLINGDGKILFKDLWLDRLQAVLKSKLK
jgi:thiol-disulfide isomerase/thioredoxin